MTSPASGRPRTLVSRVAASAAATRGLTYVLVTVFAASIVAPVIWVLSASVKTKSEFYGTPWKLPQGFHFQNYIDAFFDAHLGEYFLNSVMVTVGATAIVLLVSVPAAYGLARFRFPGRGLVRTCLMAGLFINVNYIVVPIFLMLIGWDRSLMPVTQHAVFIDSRATLALVYAATTIPFTVYLLSNFMSTIPAYYEEAAMIDGASRFRTMIQVIMPMAKPAITTVVLFDVLSYWNDFIIALTLVPGEHKTLQVGLLNLMTAQRAAANYGRLYAGMVIVMAPVLIFYALVQKRLIEGIAGGGVKG